MSPADTIYALASGKGRAGIAVIRVSGLAAGPLLARLTRAALPPARRARRSWIYRAATGERLDDALVLWFPGPGSFTGEDLVELHVHGGAAVIAAVLDEIALAEDVRLAEPGEFTRRAFLNNRMDLTEAEGLIDLIDAETEAQRKQALRQSAGHLGKVYRDWMDRLVPLLAHLEAEIDFADEELPEKVGMRNVLQIERLVEEINQHIDDGYRGERLRDGVRIAIIGPPNAGKSSLLNVLAQRDAAIVSDIAGTTRDVIEVHLDLGGYPVVLADTAGLRETADEIEDEGIRRALRAAEEADLSVVVIDASAEDWSRRLEELRAPDRLVILNKIEQTRPDIVPADCFALSVKTGDGMKDFLSALEEEVRSRYGVTEQPAITRGRHREAVIECRACLQRALAGEIEELVAEDLRLAVRALGRITGTVDVEDLLDVIFRDFCLGK